MSSIWFKILSAINERSLVLQGKNATIEVKNLDSLLADLKFIRDHWNDILHECKTVANLLKNMSVTLPVGRKKKRENHLSDDQVEDASNTTEETEFKRNTFFVIVDSVIAAITIRFEAM